ncbi:MAG: HAMP domain-containing protein, partial [Gammaproteobacteria bacterium]|nr:HAMP domain-containing protein [Gammaproteobacteria bacterium]
MPFRNLGFNQKILIATGIVITLAFAAYASFSYWRLSQDIRDNVSRTVDEIGQGAVTNISAWLNARIDILRATADQIQAETVKRQLEQAAQGGKFVTVYIGTDSGEMLLNNDDVLPEGFDPRQRPWYKDAIAAGGATLTSPYRDVTTGNLMVSPALPIRNAAYQGVISGDLDLATLTNTLNQIEFLKLGYGFMIDDKGTILAHPDSQLLDKDLSSLFEGPLPALDAPLQAARSKGQDVVVHFLPVTGLPSVKWHVGVVLDADKTYARLHEFRNNAIWGVILILIATLVVLGFTLSIQTRPIRHMQQAMNNIAQGDGDLTLRLDIHSQDELGALSKSFNQFVAHIHTLVIDVRGHAEEMGGLVEQVQ